VKLAVAGAVGIDGFAGVPEEVFEVTFVHRGGIGVWDGAGGLVKWGVRTRGSAVAYEGRSSSSCASAGLCGPPGF
jgi:hypothetical protein